MAGDESVAVNMDGGCGARWVGGRVVGVVSGDAALLCSDEVRAGSFCLCARRVCQLRRVLLPRALRAQGRGDAGRLSATGGGGGVQAVVVVEW